jgi:hypothetical protein
MDIELLDLGNFLALAVAQGLLIAHSLLEVKHADVHLGSGHAFLSVQAL